jgi:hypothetical protein
MTMARSQWVDTSVRRDFLLGEGTTNRKLWIKNRLEALAQIFSISVDGFPVLENCLHVLARLVRVPPTSIQGDVHGYFNQMRARRGDPLGPGGRARSLDDQ